MRTGWRTEAAVNSRHTDHWRLGLTIVLPWPRHGAYYISNYHQHRYLTMFVCVCALRSARQITNTSTQCVSRGNASALLFLSQPADHQGLIVQHQAVCVLQQHEVIGENTQSRHIKKTFVPKFWAGNLKRVIWYSLSACVSYYCGALSLQFH